jgi:hypothetical protein
MTTAARWRALHWFKDHAADVNAVMGRRQPTAKMRRLMIREGQLEAKKLDGFKLQAFVLTAAGAAVEASRRRNNRRH